MFGGKDVGNFGVFKEVMKVILCILEGYLKRFI